MKGRNFQGSLSIGSPSALWSNDTGRYFEKTVPWARGRFHCLLDIVGYGFLLKHTNRLPVAILAGADTLYETPLVARATDADETGGPAAA
jgi:hypothetical protein